jgi:hypothetical protein
MHRINWDLRYPDPPTLNYGYYGTLLDYREYTLNWHATPGHTYRSTIVGMMVLPGKYVATLTVDGRRYSRPLTIVRDPRVNVPATALAAQFRMQQRMVAGLTGSYEGVNHIQALRAALAARSEEASGKAGGAEIVSAAKTLDATLESLATTGFGIVHRDLGRRYSDQFIADAAPTASVLAGVDEPCKQLDRANESLRKMESTSVAALNGLLRSAGLAALPASAVAGTASCAGKGT